MGRQPFALHPVCARSRPVRWAAGCRHRPKRWLAAGMRGAPQARRRRCAAPTRWACSCATKLPTGLEGGGAGHLQSTRRCRLGPPGTGGPGVHGGLELSSMPSCLRPAASSGCVCTFQGELELGLCGHAGCSKKGQDTGVPNLIWPRHMELHPTTQAIICCSAFPCVHDPPLSPQPRRTQWLLIRLLQTPTG